MTCKRVHVIFRVTGIKVFKEFFYSFITNMLLSGPGERERESETDRQADRERDTHTDRERETHTDTHTRADREREREMGEFTQP